MVKKSEAKKEVYFIATKYKNNPAKVNFYTKSGRAVPNSSVTKTKSSEGFRFYTTFN